MAPAMGEPKLPPRLASTTPRRPLALRTALVAASLSALMAAAAASASRVSTPLGLFRPSPLGGQQTQLQLNPFRRPPVVKLETRPPVTLLDIEGPVLQRLHRAGLQDVPEALLRRCCTAAIAGQSASEPGSSTAAEEQAYVQLRNILRWRKLEGVDGILEDPAALADEQWYGKLLHYGIMPGRDRFGRAVMVEAVGRWDMRELEVAAKERSENMIRAHIAVCERLLRHAQESSEVDGKHRVPGFVAILDMHGVSSQQNPMAYPSILAVLRDISAINARYYPEAVEHVFVVNAPIVFRAIWRLLSPFVLPSSGTRVDVLRTGDEGKLLQECGREALPEQFGGTLPANSVP